MTESASPGQSLPRPRFSIPSASPDDREGKVNTTLEYTNHPWAALACWQRKRLGQASPFIAGEASVADG